MAGHSKWVNIKHRKAIQDAKRDKIFTKIIRELVIAAKLGGSDPSSNPRLRIAIDKALSNNMTRDTVNRAIVRGGGGKDISNMETIIYEGYGPGGSALMVECFSDNRNRTTSSIRYVFTKAGGNLGTNGSVSYLFSKKGVISFASVQDEHIMLETVLKTGAEDVISYDDGTFDVLTAWEDLDSVRNELEEAGLKAEAAGFSMIPSIKAELSTKTMKKLMYLIDMLESYDEVQGVYHNGNISAEISEIL